MSATLHLIPAGLSVRLDAQTAPEAEATLRACAARFGWPLPAGLVITDTHVKAPLTDPPLRGLMPFRLAGPVVCWCAVVDGDGVEQRDRR